MTTVLASVLLVSINFLLPYGGDSPFSNQTTVCLVPQSRYQNTMHGSPTEGCRGSGLFFHSVTCWFGLCETCSIVEGCEVALWWVWLPALKNFNRSLQLQYLKSGPPLTDQQLVLPAVWGTPVQPSSETSLLIWLLPMWILLVRVFLFLAFKTVSSIPPP